MVADRTFKLRLGPTSEYAALCQVPSGACGGLLVVSAAVLLPFTFGFHLLTSGDSAWRSALLRVLARVLVIAAFSLGLLFEIIWFPTRILVGVLFVTAFQLELVFAGYYANSRNVITAATFEALWLGWMLAVVMPASL